MGLLRAEMTRAWYTRDEMTNAPSPMLGTRFHVLACRCPDLYVCMYVHGTCPLLCYHLADWFFLRLMLVGRWVLGFQGEDLVRVTSIAPALLLFF